MKPETKIRLVWLTYTLTAGSAWAALIWWAAKGGH